MLGSDFTAQGGQGTLDQFNVGKAMVNGLELMFHYLPLPRHFAVQAAHSAFLHIHQYRDEERFHKFGLGKCGLW